MKEILTIKPRKPRDPALAAAVAKIRAQRAGIAPRPDAPSQRPVKAVPKVKPPKATPKVAKPSEPPSGAVAPQRKDPSIQHRAAQWMRREYPALFTAGNPKPLAIGIQQHLVKARPETVSHLGISRALTRWVQQSAYQQALAAEGARRFNLDSSDAGPVSDEHRNHAKQLLDKRQTEKSDCSTS